MMVLDVGVTYDSYVRDVRTTRRE